MNVVQLTSTLLLSAACIFSFSSATAYDNSNDLHHIMSTRHSGRSYDPSKNVTLDQIRALVNAASLAPSSYNDQPWNFIICDKTTNPEAYKKAFSSLVEFNQGWARNAPLLIVVVANLNSRKNKTPNDWGVYDTGAAAYGLALKAHHLGLMAHQMAGFDQEKIRKEFQIPSGYKPLAVIAVGYEAQGETVAPKERLPIGQNFFDGVWGHGLQ